MLAALFAFFLLSLIGIPFTGGFFGKFYVFAAALQAGHVWLAVIGLINSGVACFYYLGCSARSTQSPERRRQQQLSPLLRPISVPAGIGLTLTAAATLLLGILPGHVLHLANSAGSGLRATSATATPSASSADSPPSLPPSGQPR